MVKEMPIHESLKTRESRLKDSFFNSNRAKSINNIDLVKFLFRSEDTAEWLLGAKELGRLAAIDEYYCSYLYKWLENLKNCENKNDSEINTHALRHGMLALLSYLSSIIKNPSLKESKFKYSNNTQLPSDFFLEVFQHFEMSGIQHLVERSKEYKNFGKYSDRLFELGKVWIQSNLNKEKVEQEKLEKSLESIASNPKALESKQKLITESVKKIESHNNLLKEINTNNSKLRPDIIDEFKEYIEFDKKKTKIDEYFSSFENWTIGSFYFAFPEFYMLISKDNKNSITNKFAGLNWELVLKGMIFYGTKYSPEYFKCGLYVIDYLDSDFPELAKEVINDGHIYLDIIKKNSYAHFTEAVLELTSWIQTDPFEYIKSNNLIATQIPTNKDKIQIFRDSLRYLKNEIDESETSPRSSVLHDQYIICSLSLSTMSDYKDAQKYLVKFLNDNLINTKQILPFLTLQLKKVFYERLKELFYNRVGNLKPKDVSLIENELLTQLLVGYKIIKEWSIPKQANKEIGTIFARILQTSFLLDKSLDQPISFPEKFYSLLYTIPIRKVFEEIRDYLAIEELESLFIATISAMEKEKTSNYQEFRPYFDSISKNLAYKNYYKIFESIGKGEELDANQKLVIKDLVSIKIRIDKLISIEDDILGDERGIEYLKDYVENNTVEIIEELDSIHSGRVAALALINNRKLKEETSIENDLKDEIIWMQKLIKWTSENLPYPEYQFLKFKLKDEIQIKNGILIAFKNNNEANIIDYYSNPAFSNYHSVFERWMARRLLFREILRINKKSSPNTNFGKSRIKKIFSTFYQIVSNPIITISFISLPFILYVIGLSSTGNTILAANISLINFSIPLIAIILVLSFLLKSFRKIGFHWTKKKKIKAESISMTLKGIQFSDFFLPKIFGLILIAVMTFVMDDGNWTVSFGFSSFYLWKYFLMIVIVFLFIKNSVMNVLGGITNEEAGASSISIKTTSISNRIWRVLTIGLLEAQIISLYLGSSLSVIMLQKTDANEFITQTGTNIIGIPKIVNLDVIIPSFSGNLIATRNIAFAPFFIFSTVVLVLFVGIVLNTFLNKDEIL